MPSVIIIADVNLHLPKMRRLLKLKTSCQPVVSFSSFIICYVHVHSQLLQAKEIFCKYQLMWSQNRNKYLGCEVNSPLHSCCVSTVTSEKPF